MSTFKQYLHLFLGMLIALMITLPSAEADSRIKSKRSKKAVEASAQERVDNDEYLRIYWQEQLLRPLDDEARSGQIAPLPAPKEQENLSLMEDMNGFFASSFDNQKYPNIDHLKFADMLPSQYIGTLSTLNGWPYLETSQYRNFMSNDSPISIVPDWLFDIADREIRHRSLKANKVPLLPESNSNSNTEMDFRTRWEHDDVLILAGPALQPGTVTFQPQEKITIARIATGLGALYYWSRKQGLPFDMKLLRSNRPVSMNSTVAITASTKIPVWIVTSKKLLPATLTSYSSRDDNCSENRIELAIPGQTAPAIWAILAFDDPSLARGVTVRQLQEDKAERESSSESERKTIEVSWKNNRMPAIRISARKFDWTEREYEQLPDGNYRETSRKKLGSAWATQIKTDTPKEIQKNYSYNEIIISSAGTSRCATQ